MRAQTWYPVNLWLQRAMAEIADFLPQDDELGAQLRGNASEFRAQLATSVAACTVPANASGFAHPLMLPPFARKLGEFAVFRNMTKDVRAPIEAHDLASYTNCACPFFAAFPNVLTKLPRNSSLLGRDAAGRHAAARDRDGLAGLAQQDGRSTGWRVSLHGSPGRLSQLVGHPSQTI